MHRTLIFNVFLFIFLFSGLIAAQADELSDKDLCRAAISTVMDEDLKDVEFMHNVLNVQYVKIPKQKDNSTFKFKCTAVEGVINWASDLGPWQNTDLDSKVTYEIKDGFLIVSELYNSGYRFNKRFKLSTF